MFETLSDRLQEIIKKTSGNTELTEENMSDSLREIRRALLEADVNLKVVKAFISNIKTRAEGEEVLKGVNPAQQLVMVLNHNGEPISGKLQLPLKAKNVLDLRTGKKLAVKKQKNSTFIEIHAEKLQSLFFLINKE